MLLRKRNSFFLLLILLSTDIYGQQNLLEQRISIQFTNDPVSEALDKLSKAANCDFFYRPSDLPLNRNITRTFNNELVDVIIKSVWGTDQLILRAGSNDISIKPKREPKKTSEKGSLQGVITDEKGKPVPFATVAIIGTGKGVIADEEGKFQINQLPEGDYQLSISSSGFKVKDLAVEVIADQTVTLRIEMIFATNELDEVVIFGKTDSQLKMEQPIKVEVINTEKLQTKSISLPQVINQTSGINVRQTGAIGRPAIININGLQGNAIRYFKDDIPMDYLGRAFDITLLPVDQLDNIEIYKGVLPAELGADALGGALNFTTRQNSNNNLDLAYTIGSFNTHQVNMNGYYDIPNSKFFASLASYYVYSDNNYKVKVEIPNPVTANLEETEVERFHDGIETYFAEGKVGLRDFKYGDLLVFGYARFDWEKERQNGIQLDPNSALGEVMDLETSDIFSLRYKLTKGKFHLDAFGAYSNRNTIFEDNPEFRYNWLGEQLPLINQGGETSFTSKFYRELNFETWTGRVKAVYKLGSNHEVAFNHNTISENRIGSDTLEIIFGTDLDPNSFPSSYTRNITGIGLGSTFFKDKIQNVFSVKRFHINTSSIAANLGGFSQGGTIEEVIQTSYGFNNSTKFSLNSNRFIRVSYEFATRIPESIEFLGDGLFVLSNPFLKPETSHNINFGFYTNLGKKKNHWLDINLFGRFVRDNIVPVPVGFTNVVFSNADDSRSFGYELSLKGQLTKSLKYNFSVTYQDIRRANSSDLDLEASRIPNIPYFFSNLGLRYTYPKLFLSGNWDAYLNYGFVEQYLLTARPKELEPPLFGSVDQIDSKTIINAQHTLDVGLTYKNNKHPFWISLEANNVLDIPVFDGFRVQLPGRNFRLKLKYRINGK